MTVKMKKESVGGGRKNVGKNHVKDYPVIDRKKTPIWALIFIALKARA